GGQLLAEINDQRRGDVKPPAKEVRRDAKQDQPDTEVVDGSGPAEMVEPGHAPWAELGPTGVSASGGIMTQGADFVNGNRSICGFSASATRKPPRAFRTRLGLPDPSGLQPPDQLLADGKKRHRRENLFQSFGHPVRTNGRRSRNGSMCGRAVPT